MSESNRPPVILDRDLAEAVMTNLLALRDERSHWRPEEMDPEEEPELKLEREQWWEKFLRLLDEYHKAVYTLRKEQVVSQRELFLFMCLRNARLKKIKRGWFCCFTDDGLGQATCSGEGDTIMDAVRAAYEKYWNRHNESDE